MANAQGQAQAALNQVNAKIAALTSQINTLQGKIDRSLQSKATRMSDAEQDDIADQIDSLKNQRGDLQEEAARLSEQANPGASDKKLAERQQERASMKQGWDDEVAASKKATTTGAPESRAKTAFSESRTTSTEDVTGGGTTTFKSADPNPAQEKYYREYKTAQDADVAANNAQREEYLRSKGLDSATPAQKRAAVREARERGDLPPEKEPGSDFKAANPNPPPGSPATITSTAGENTSVTTETVEKTGASANTAGDVVTAAERPPIVNGQAGQQENAGTGTDVSTNSTAEPLTEDEKKQINDSTKSSTDTNTSVVTDNKTSTGQAPSKANEEAKQGLFANQQYDQSGQPVSATIKVGDASSTESKLKEYVPAKITPNPLHAYATYTYSLSLHLLTPEAYNKLADGEDWLPYSKTLIAGGGRWGTDVMDKGTFFRAAQFKDDFYFDGLSLDTIIGMNAQSRGANAIQFKFNIIEPYGFTLVNRLLELSIEMKQPNYLTNPYVLQIDFFGNNDAGEPMHPCTDSQGRSLTKYLPCKIIEMKIKVGTNGATYACQAIPYNHAAFAETVGVTPANFEVVANTVGNFFTNDADDAGLIKQVEERQRQSDNDQQNMKWAQVMVNTKEGGATEADKEKLQQQAKKAAAAANAPFKAKSYTGAYNAYQQYLVLKKHCDHPVIIKFDIHPDIANAKIVEPEKNSPSTTPAVDVSDDKERKKAVDGNKDSKGAKPPAAGVKTDVARFNVNAGDQILELINKVMRNSTYITEQLKGKDPVIKTDDEGNQTDKDGKPLKWFKVIPKLKLTNFDPVRNDWGSEITYHIVPYQYHNSKHPAVSTSDNNEIRRNLRKKYSYIYSGQNSDILDFSLDFNTVFYTAVKVLAENTARLGASSDSSAISTTDDPNTIAETPDQQTKVVQPNMTHPVGTDLGAGNGLNASNNPDALRAADVMKSIYSGARGDMINIKLKIIGDPDFIKTDDIYYNPGNANYPGPGDATAPDGSILTDRGDIFAFVSWRTPSDLNEETGLPEFKKFQNSAFDGVYKIIKVTCDLKGGGFEQTLDMIRFHDGIKNILEEEGIEQRDERNARNKKKEEMPVENNQASTTPDLPEGSRKATDAASLREAQNAARGNETDQEQNANLARVATDGNVVTAEQDSNNQSTSQDNTAPRIANAQSQSPQVDGAAPVKNEGGSQPQVQNPPAIDRNNLPAGVTVNPDSGLLVYRGVTIRANDQTDLQNQINAIDNGTTVKTTRVDAESGKTKEVEFDGSKTRPESKDSEIAALQNEYSAAQTAAAGAQRRIDNANAGMFDDEPGKKQKVIDGNTKALNDANAKMAALEARLKDKGAAPR